MYLMLGDRKVLYFDFDDFVVQVINPNLVPFSMRYRFKEPNDNKSILYNVQLLKSWLSRRVLSLHRDNAKEIFKLFNIPQSDDIETRVKVCIKCKGVSINDSYWVTDDTRLKFSDVNIRIKPFREIVDIALEGVAPSITTSPLNPELTTHGLFRKAWVRKEDGLYLLKSDKHSECLNTRMELLASKVLDCFSNKVECVKYSGRWRNTKNGRFFVNSCKCFAKEEFSFVEAWELMEYAKAIGESFEGNILGYSPLASSIAILDYVIANTDRHDQNYGFWMSNVTGQLSGLAPIFDYNLALVSDILGNNVENTFSQMFNDSRTIGQLARHYLPFSHLVLDYTLFKELRKKNKDFDNVFECILNRCRLIGLI